MHLLNSYQTDNAVDRSCYTVKYICNHWKNTRPKVEYSSRDCLSIILIELEKFKSHPKHPSYYNFCTRELHDR